MPDFTSYTSNLTRPQVDEFRSPKAAIKLVNVVLIIIALGIFFSTYQSWAQFVGTTIASGMVYGVSLVIIYLFGDGQFQTTFYEPMMNGYFSFMFFISAIVCWAKSGGSYGYNGYSYSSGILISTGLFCFLISIVFAVETYFTLLRSGTMAKLRGTAHNTSSTQNHQNLQNHQNSATNEHHDYSSQPPPAYTNPPPSAFPAKTTVFPASEDINDPISVSVSK